MRREGHEGSIEYKFNIERRLLLQLGDEGVAADVAREADSARHDHVGVRAFAGQPAPHTGREAVYIDGRK